MYPPLFSEHKPQTMRQLLCGGANPNQEYHLGKTPLCFAESPEQAEVLLRAGADINGTRLTSPLHHIADPATMEYLIQRGADINRRDQYRRTPLFTVKNRECAELLIAAGAQIHTFDVFGLSPLHYLRSREVAEAFVAAGADLNIHKPDGVYPMETIKPPEILFYLYEHGGRVPFRKRGDLFAEGYGSARTRLYLDAGANPAMKDSRGRTLLHTVSTPEQLQQLVEKYGLNINARDNAGRTPVFYVKDMKMFQSFLQYKKLDLLHTDRSGQNLLHQQNIVAHPEIVQILVQRGVNVNLKDKKGNTPLHLCINSINAVQTLLACGASPILENAKGEKPQDLIQNEKILALLYHGGADISTPGPSGETVFERCSDSKAIRDFINRTGTAMSVSGDPAEAPQANPEDVIPPELRSAAESGDSMYFLAMFDLYADESIMPELIRFLIHKQKRLCAELLELKDFSEQELDRISAELNEQERSTFMSLLTNHGDSNE